MKIALAGNPNSGKTTMFNALTGSNERVGNWAGVTVDKKERSIKKAYTNGRKITVVDIRYIQSGFVGNFVDFDKGDVLFLYSTTLLNNSMAMR